MNLRQKRDLRRLTRQIIQIIFFLWMPALYTSAFSGVRYVIEQIRAGKPIEQNAFLVMLIVLCGFTILFGRFFCQYLCPMGAIFAWLPVLPFSVLDRDRSNCIPKCRACEIKCPVDYQIKRDQKNGGECIHCMQCVDVCPKQNIHLGSGNKLKGNEIFIILAKLALFIGVCIFAQGL